MTNAVFWWTATPAARAAVAGWIAETHGDVGADACISAHAGHEEAGASATLRCEVLRDNARRCIVRIDHEGMSFVVKRFRSTSGRHRFRETLKAAFGRAPAQREWRALQRAHAAGVPVVQPLGFGQLGGGDPILVLAFARGAAFEVAHGNACPLERRALQRALGHAVRQLHAVGLCHGDLQHGNILVSERGPLLLDLQRATRATDRARVRDLGFLEHSLRAHVTTPGRWRCLRAALDERAQDRDATAARLRASRGPDVRSPALRGWLHAVLNAGNARADVHARSRTRHALRPGRAFARQRHGNATGLRVAELSERDARLALDAHAMLAADGASARDATHDTSCVLKRDARAVVTRVHAGTRRVVVKETFARGALRPLADLWRGSPGWRAWRGGHGLLARGIGAARPLAFVETRRFGLPWGSIVVLEDLAPDIPADRAIGAEAEARGLTAHGVVAALGTLAEALHRARVRHGDLKASHALLRRTRGGVETRLIDLEGVRFERRLDDDTRRLELAQLNASLPDAFDARSRRLAFDHYAKYLPFEAGQNTALRAVIDQSLTRRHRWTAHDCPPRPRQTERGRTY